MDSILHPPKKSSLPVIDSEETRDDAIRSLSPTHGYTIAEVSYLLNVHKRTIMRYIVNGTFTAHHRGVHPLVTGIQIKKFYFC